MAFTTRQPSTPTDIGRVRITLADNTRESSNTIIQNEAYNTPYPLEHGNVLAGSVSVQLGGITYVESTDYTVDYANGQITFLDTGNIQQGVSVLVRFLYHVQTAGFRLEILDQNYEVMEERSGDLSPHVTTQERDALINFLDTIRARATTEIIG